MIRRELIPPSATSADSSSSEPCELVVLILAGSRVVVERWQGGRGRGAEEDFVSRTDARATFKAELRRLLSSGYTESPRSLSRQELTIRRGRKLWFWAVEIDGSDRITCFVEWG